MISQYQSAEDLVYTAIDNESSTATPEERAGEWHYLAAWDRVHEYTDGTNISADEYRAAFRAAFPWFDPTVR